VSSNSYDRHLGLAHHGGCTPLGLGFRPGRLATVFALLVYAPVLLGLPVLLAVGLVFVLVPGGFMIVFGALYYASAWVMG
jgi:hypothetical protein